MKIERVCWPIASGTEYESRPAALVAALQRRRFLQQPVFEHHGGQPGDGRRSWTSLLTPRRDGRPTAILSPLWILSELDSAVWIDVYDDWRIAPEMNFLIRGLAAVGIERLRRSERKVVVTTNSLYLRDLLKPVAATYVPNGVDPQLREFGRGSDRVRRVVMMGNFFPGRTDMDALMAIAGSSEVDEVIIYGYSAKVQQAISSLPASARSRISLRPKSPLKDIAAASGLRTVLAVPHVVSDYTLSQDLMKAYQAIALGMYVIAPQPLIPQAIGARFGFSWGPGVDVDSVLAGVFAVPPITGEQADSFVGRNSWDARAASIAGLFHEN